MKKLIILALFIISITFGYSADKEYNFLVITDIHLDVDKKTPMVINPPKYSSENELDKKTFDRMTFLISSSLGNQITKPNSIFVLGDMVHHGSALHLWNNSKDDVYKNQSYIYNLFNVDFANIPVLYTFGNNDNISHYGIFFEKNSSSYKISKENGLDGYISHTNFCYEDAPKPCIVAENTVEGHYATMLDDKLEMINLNSISFSRKFSGDIKHPQSEIDFLERQLLTAKRLGNSVIIAMHIPVGNDSYDDKNLWVREYTNLFVDIVEKYKDNIIGIVNGHTHTEEFRILRVDDKTNIGEFTSPSLTTAITNAPGFNSFTLVENNGKWTIKDYTAYKFTGNNIGDLAIKKLFTFSDEYCDKNYAKNINNCLNNVDLNKIEQFLFLENPNAPHREFSEHNLYIN
jgi:alkaline phosphatase D